MMPILQNLTLDRCRRRRRNQFLRNMCLVLVIAIFVPRSERTWTVRPSPGPAIVSHNLKVFISRPPYGAAKLKTRSLLRHLHCKFPGKRFSFFCASIPAVTEQQ